MAPKNHSPTSNNNCCCCSLQDVICIVAVLDLIGGIAGVIFYTITAVDGGGGGLKSSSHSSSNGLSEFSSKNADTVVIVCLLAILASIVQFILSLILLYGTIRKNLRCCEIWIIAHSLLLTISITGFIALIVTSFANIGISFVEFFSSLLGFIYRGCVIWLVDTFRDLNLQGGGGSGMEEQESGSSIPLKGDHDEEEAT